MIEKGAQQEISKSGKITLDIADFIGWLTFDNPKKHNALSQKLWRDLPQHIKLLEDDFDVRVIVLRGAGNRAFCAGADISEFAIVRKDANTARLYEQENIAAFEAIKRCKKPIIAMINGLCFGGGFGIAAAADLRIADENAEFAVPAAKLGLAYPVSAISNIVTAVGEQIAKELLFTARRFTAAEMFDCGFLSKTSTTGQLLNEVSALAQTIAENAPLSIRAAKQAILAPGSGDCFEAMKYADEIAASTFESNDYREGRAAFKARRKPNFGGT